VSEYDYLTMEDALYFCEKSGLYIRDPGALDSALARPASIVFGVESYQNLHLKGAALLDAINRNHPLLDGNKRLAWTLVDAFFTLNGWALRAPPVEIDDFVRAVGGDEHPALEDIATWLRTHSLPLEDDEIAGSPATIDRLKHAGM
jgi:death-on-curing protein